MAGAGSAGQGGDPTTGAGGTLAGSGGLGAAGLGGGGGTAGTPAGSSGSGGGAAGEPAGGSGAAGSGAANGGSSGGTSLGGGAAGAQTGDACGFQAGSTTCAPTGAVTSCCGVVGAILDLENHCWVGSPVPAGAGGPPVKDTPIACWAASCKAGGLGCYRLTLDGRQVKAYTASKIINGLSATASGTDARVCTPEEETTNADYALPLCPSP